MSNVEQEDPFEVLGVTRDVEERELKKRYFGLLREFPPETHPEQFARIQRAWEIVSDPERRAEHLAVSQPYEGVAEPWRTRLREALRLLSNGEVDLGRVQLKTLLEEKPDLNDARELLQQVYFNHEQWAEAEVQLRELIARQPEQTHFLSRLVLVLGRLDRHVDALAVAHQWLEVSQRKDPMAWVYIAETLAAQKRHPEALVAIADGLLAVEAKSPLLLTRLQMRLDLELKPAKALFALQADLAELERVAASDDDTRKAISQRLQSMAALFFNRNRADEANALISASRRFWSQSQAVHFPPFVDVEIDDLGPKAKAWLDAETKEQHVFRVLKRGRVADLFLALLFTVPTALLAGQLVTTDSRWFAGPLVMLCLVLAALAWLTVWAWRQVTLSFTVSRRRMVSVQGLYLLEVGIEKLRAWPLVNFSDVRVVHHHTNGVYTNSVATLTFVKKKVNLSIRGQALAVQFAETLQAFRYRALQLLHGGMLEAEEGYDFIPHSFLAPKFKSPLASVRRRALLIRSAAIFGVTLVLGLVALALGERAQHERELSAVINSQRSSQLALVFADASNRAEQETIKRWFRAQLHHQGGRLLENVAVDSVRTTRLTALLKALEATDFGAMRVIASVGGATAGFSETFDRAVEEGFGAERSAFATSVVQPGVWKSAKSLELRLALTATPVANVGIGPGAKAPLQRLSGTASFEEVAVPIEVTLSEGEVLALAGPDVAAVQAKALGKKVGALLADELGVGRTAIAVVQ